jgi:hypothetical protein
MSRLKIRHSFLNYYINYVKHVTAHDSTHTKNQVYGNDVRSILFMPIIVCYATTITFEMRTK